VRLREERNVRTHLVEPGALAPLIERGEGLLLAGDEPLLRDLPRGNWIGGTIPYFMSEAGGLVDRRRVFVNELSGGLRCEGIRRYGPDELARVYADLLANDAGFGFMIAPAWSKAHLSFALDAPSYQHFAVRPLAGWIAGTHLAELGTVTPKVFDGRTGEALEDQAVVMRVSVPPGKAVELDVVNIFSQGDGPTISFPSSGFSATAVDIDGRRRNLAEYIAEVGLDTRLPLVADCCGANVNVSFLNVDKAQGEVRFYGPVFADVPYRHARPVADYVSAFLSRLPTDLGESLLFSCNCVLNYLHSGLEGRRTGDIVGPITFGEIAYQLLNQTMVYLVLEETQP
jgi:Family of unknown function (DUF6976)